MPLILNQSQAEAIYSAMCALNNVGGRLDVSVPSQSRPNCTARVLDRGHVIWVRDGGHQGAAWEDYADQTAFATAYGLSSGRTLVEGADGNFYPMEG